MLLFVYFMCGSRIFVRGGGGVQARWPENSLDNFVSPQLILQFTERDNGFISEKTILSQGSRGGPTFSRGGPSFSRGGGCPNADFYRNPYNL